MSASYVQPQVSYKFAPRKGKREGDQTTHEHTILGERITSYLGLGFTMSTPKTSIANTPLSNVPRCAVSRQFWLVYTLSRKHKTPVTLCSPAESPKHSCGLEQRQNTPRILANLGIRHKKYYFHSY